MFYCNPCGLKNNWPINTPINSYGPCEICSARSLCNDVPSRALPSRQEQADDDDDVGTAADIVTVVETVVETAVDIADAFSSSDD